MPDSDERITRIAYDLELRPLPAYPERVSRPNRDVERNRVIVECIRAGISTQDLADYFDLTRQRISAIWHEWGDGDNIRFRRMKMRQEGRL